MVKQLSARSRYRFSKTNGGAARTEPLDTAPIDVALPEGVGLHSTGLRLPDEMTSDAWCSLGQQLTRLHTGVQWALGDWWVFGEHKYGERKAAAVAKGLPYEFETLMNLGYVARNVAASLRNEVLSFSHHYAVASLSPPEQERWLSKAVRSGWSVKAMRRRITEKQAIALDDQPAERARLWQSHLLTQASRAQDVDPFGLGEAAWDDPRLDHLGDREIAELVASGTAVQVAWATMVRGLERYCEWRAAQGADFIARPLDPLDVPRIGTTVYDHEGEPILDPMRGDQEEQVHA